MATSLQKIVTCPICLEILQKPVSLGCGHSFCHNCIIELKEAYASLFTCPLCDYFSNNDTLVTSWVLVNLVEEIRSMDPSEVQPAEDQLRCPKHVEKPHYFCEEDEELLYEVCHDSKDHKFHNASLIEEADQHHQTQVEFEKQQIHSECKHLQQVQEEEENVLLSNMEGVKECEHYDAATQTQLSLLEDSLKAKQQTPPRQLLQDIEGTLHRSEEVHSTAPVALDINEKLKNAKRIWDSVFESMKNLEEKLQAGSKEDQSKFLQDKRTVCQQTRFLLEKNNPNTGRSSQPEPASPAKGDPTTTPRSSTLHTETQFKRRFRSCFKIHIASPDLSLPRSRTFFMTALRNASDADTGNTWSIQVPSSSLGLQPVLTPVTFDVASAHPDLKFSQDLKQVTMDRIPLKHSEAKADLQRFFPSRCVLGSPGFSTGRHTWVVERSGPQDGACVIGVAWEQAPRQGSLTLEPEKGFWVLKITSFECQALTGSNTWEDFPVRPKRVGVCIDLEGKEVSFYDPDTNNHIYTFQASFPGKIFPFFRLLFSGTQLTLSP